MKSKKTKKITVKHKKLNGNSLKEILTKKALGFVSQEITEEFLQQDDTLKLVKRKVVKKEVPPDITAIKFLLEFENDNLNSLENLSDEELEKEKNRLLELLKEDEI